MLHLCAACFIDISIFIDNFFLCEINQQFKMNNTRKDEHSRFKMAQLWHSISSTSRSSRKDYLHNRIINEILNDDFDINYKINPVAYRKTKNHFQDCTALHFSYYDVYDICTFRTLIERGADYTLKNGNGQTVLHLIMTTCRSYDIEKEIPFINSVLSAHVKSQNSVNPHDHNGFSHLHAACIANHTESVEFFLDNGASIDEATDLKASKFARYTPLHFAAKYGRFEVAQILVRRGVNINAKDAKGMSPLDFFMMRKFIDLSSQSESSQRDQMVTLFLENGGVSAVGLSSLQVALTLKDLTIAERLLNGGADVDYVVPMNSLYHSGHTAIDFALEHSIEAVKMLILRGAKVNFAKGSTFVDTFLEKYGLQNFCDILSCIDSTKEICLSDGKTKLVDLISTMSNLNEFKDFLQKKIKDIGAIIPNNSVLWPGYTILHLAVKLPSNFTRDHFGWTREYDRSIMEECLNQGMSLNVKDARGQTPIHLAFVEGKNDIAESFLNRLDHLMNITDEDNLSYLHIACKINEVVLVEKLLSFSDPNVEFKGTMEVFETGMTPLHIAVDVGSHEIADILLRHGADLHATTAAGLTPIHYLLKSYMSSEAKDLSKVLFRSLLTNPVDRIVENLGLSYLHVACHFEDEEIVEKLIEIGSDVNAVVNYDEGSDNSVTKSALMCFDKYFNHTPLQFVVKPLSTNEKIVELLLRRVVYKMPINNKIVMRCFFEMLWKHESLQKVLQKVFGLTKLHIACFLKDKEVIENVLNDGIDVNAQVYANSTMFAGCTPLHLLMTIVDTKIEFLDCYIPQFEVGSIVEMLVDRGADVTIANAEKDTPIHVFFKYLTGFIDAEYCRDMLLNAQKNFNINPANVEGLTHFHIACLWQDYECVKKFLQHGSVDVNQPIDLFSSQDPGCTPLHMALNVPMNPDDDWVKLSKLVDLLLENGANVSAVDVDGETPLHKPAVLCSPEMSMLEKLVNHGGDVKTENIVGLTPIEVWPRFRRIIPNQPDYATVFEKFDCKINRWNRLTGEGYIGKTFILDQTNLFQNAKFQQFLNSPDARSIDDEGRTAIHNAVAHSGTTFIEENNNYIYAIGCFIKMGIDIDYQDKSGQTALHYAARMENAHGVKALLACGADINIVDSTGKSALYYAVKYAENKCDIFDSIFPNSMMFLRCHVQKLHHLNIEVSQYNRDLVKKIETFDDPILNLYDKATSGLSQKFFNQLEMTKALTIDTHSLTLHDFLCETGAANFYALLPKFKRQIVDNFFKSTDLNKLYELRGIIILQFRKMKTRLGLIDSALSSLRVLLGFSVPDLCEQISQYLINSDLENLIESTTSKTKKRTFLEITN